jgi:HKD family nuclease
LFHKLRSKRGVINSSNISKNAILPDNTWIKSSKYGK